MYKYLWRIPQYYKGRKETETECRQHFAKEKSYANLWFLVLR